MTTKTHATWLMEKRGLDKKTAQRLAHEFASCEHDWQYLEREPGETYTGYCERCSKCQAIQQIPQ